MTTLVSAAVSIFWILDCAGSFVRPTKPTDLLVTGPLSEFDVGHPLKRRLWAPVHDKLCVQWHWVPLPSTSPGGSHKDGSRLQTKFWRLLELLSSFLATGLTAQLTGGFTQQSQTGAATSLARFSSIVAPQTHARVPSEKRDSRQESS